MISLSAFIVPVLHGENSTMRTGLKATELGIKKALVIYDAGVFKAGIVGPIIESLKASRIEVVTFDKVTPDPPDYMVNEGGELAIREKIDGIVAIGGGSTLDTAKGINFLTCNEGPINKWFFPSSPQGKSVPMIAIPTTAGTGSEGSFAAVVTDSKAGKKGAMLDPEFCRFSLVIQDPKMYVGLPAKPSAYCAFDVLCHAVDSIFSTYNEVYSIAFAEIAIRKVVKYLPQILKNPGDLKARGEVAFAATLGGNVLNTNMAGCTHTMGHSIGAVCHIPHGLAVALTLSSLIELHFCKWDPEKTKLVGDCFGVKFSGEETPEEIGKMTAAAVHKFYLECGIETISQLNLKKEDLAKAVTFMTNDIQTPTVPVLLSGSQYQAVLDHMYTL